MRRALTLLVFVATVAMPCSLKAQEAVMEEVRVEGVSPLELSNDRQVDLFTRRLLEHDENKHALELQLANQNPLTTLLNLTSVSPIPLGSSENRVDTFFLQNYMRADLNPPEGSALFPARGKRNSR